MRFRLPRNPFSWVFFVILVALLFLWAWSTGFRTYLLPEDYPVIVLALICLVFVMWIDWFRGKS